MRMPLLVAKEAISLSLGHVNNAWTITDFFSLHNYTSTIVAMIIVLVL